MRVFRSRWLHAALLCPLSLFLWSSMLLILVAGRSGAAEVATRGQYVRAIQQLAPVVQSREPRNFLLLIAINKYRDSSWTELKTPVQDAEAVRDVLVERYYFEKTDCRTLFNEEATRGNIFEAFEQLRGQLNGEDNLIVYYAGHGEEVAGSGYWIPFDGGPPGKSHSWVSYEEIRTRLRALKDAKHVLLVVDSCFSGDFFRGADLNPQMPGSYKNAFKRVSRRALTSGGAEPVKDLGIGDDHSVFAHFLLRALRENKAQFTVFSSPDLFGYIKDGLAGNQLQLKQTPQYGFIRDAGGAPEGELVLIQRDGFFQTSSLPAEEPVAVSAEIAEPSVEAKPSNTDSIRFSNPQAGTLSIGGKRYNLGTQPLVHLAMGVYPFTLLLPDQRPIFGKLNVHYVDDETQLATFGDSDGIFFRDAHIRSCLEGRPVIYAVNFTGSKGTLKTITYVLSLQKIL